MTFGKVYLTERCIVIRKGCIFTVYIVSSITRVFVDSLRIANPASSTECWRGTRNRLVCRRVTLRAERVALKELVEPGSSGPGFRESAVDHRIGLGQTPIDVCLRSTITRAHEASTARARRDKHAPLSDGRRHERPSAGGDIMREPSCPRST